MGNRLGGTRLGVLLEQDRIEGQGFALGTEVLRKGIITGTPGDDKLIGTSQGDTVDGGLGADRMKGHGGDDSYIVDNVGDVVIEAAGPHKGVDTVYASVEYTLGDNVENLTLTNAAGNRGYGNELDNVITGGLGSYNTLVGAGGNDTLIGSDKVDRLQGGDGDDLLQGGLGSDGLYGDAGNDTLLGGGADGPLGLEELHGGVGDDLLLASPSLMFGEDGNDTLIGSASMDLGMNGGAGDDFIFGGEGEDVLIGGDGNDILLDESEGDVLSGGAGIDTLVGSGSWNGDVHGGDGNDLIFANGRVRGEQGADTFDIESGAYIDDFGLGSDVLNIDALTRPVGDGDGVVEGATTRAAPGGFASSAELVIFSTPVASAPITVEAAAAAIGSATSAYAVGDTALFVLHNDSNDAVFYFESSGNNAKVDASELSYLATVHVFGSDGSTQVSDYRFDHYDKPSLDPVLQQHAVLGSLAPWMGGVAEAQNGDWLLA
ncbi:MAG TPA: calcium-binding protein [Ideonella sp.]|nr:calcium-binding protein [Ideonella sp.]